MKSYAITIALVLLIAASLGTYYAFGADLHIPEYRLQTIEGDPAEAAELTLLGSYAGGKGSYALQVSTAGSDRSEPSFWSQWLESDGPFSSQTYSDIRSLYQEYSGFMRGKSDTYGFYRDQDMLIYAQAKDSQQDGTIRWTIDVLDLASGKQTHYADEQIQHANDAYVLDVQKIGTEIHVLTSVGTSNPSKMMIDKVFDSLSGKPVRSVQLPLGESAGPDRELRIKIIAEEKPTAANPRVLFNVSDQSKIASSTTAKANDQTFVTFSEHLYVYHYTSGDVKEVPLADSADDNKVTSTIYTLNRDELSTLQATDEALTIDRYDLSTEQAHPQLTIKADQLGTGRISQVQAVNGRIYLLLQTGAMLSSGSMPIAAVADATDGRILYQGKPILVDSNGRPDDQLDDVWLLNLSVNR